MLAKQEQRPLTEANAYKGAVYRHLAALISQRATYSRVLDFGSGDGWFAHQLTEAGALEEVTPVDVQRRRQEFIAPQLYDGQRLPFPDRSFDLVYAVDVLHHCPDPVAALKDLLRVSSGDVILKDHTFRGRGQKLLLGIMDELGNRRFGVPSPYRYQREWEWLPTFTEAGFTHVHLRHPLPCDPRIPWRWLTPQVQFLGLWERKRD